MKADKWFLVSGSRVEEVASPAAGLAKARNLEWFYQREYGPQSGIDCWVVAQRGSEIRCGKGSGGMCLDKSFIQVQCQHAVDCVYEHLKGESP